MKGVLSVIIPVYNEERTIRGVLSNVLGNELVGQVIVVDDFSNDRTCSFVEKQKSVDDRIIFVKHSQNMGKGASIRTAVEYVTLPFAVIQDADFEYDPREYRKLLDPLVQDKCDVCYGSRYLKQDPRRVLKFWHTIGNRFLTTLSNMLSNLYVTDMETCYKAFKVETLRSFHIQEDRFGFEPEITAKIAKSGARVCEVAISYNPRSREEGKHIGWIDAVSAIWCILKYNL